MDRNSLVDALSLVVRAETTVISGNWYSGMNETVMKLKRIANSIQVRIQELPNESR